MNEFKSETDPLNGSAERVLRRFLPAALAEMASDAAPSADKPPPGPPMPQGAPLRFRTPEFDALVNTYAERLAAACDFAARHPGARGDKAIEDAKRITVAMAPSSRNQRRRDGTGDQGTRGLEFVEAKRYLDVQRYAMNEAIARVFGAGAIQEQRGRFRIYAKSGKRAGRGDRRTFASVPYFIRGEPAGTFETVTIEKEVG